MILNRFKLRYISTKHGNIQSKREVGRKNRRDDNYGRAGAFAVLLLAADCPSCPTLFAAVGISIKGVFPCPPAPPPVTKGRTPSHLVVLSHSKYVGLFLSCWSIIVIACASPSACKTLDCLIPSALAMLAFCSPIALASFCCASICILLNSF